MRVTRRTVLGTAALSAGIAGCLGGGDGNGDADSGNGDSADSGNGDTGNGDSDAGNGDSDTGNGDSDTDTTTRDEETTTAADVPTVSVRSRETYGDILVGPEGMTLYMFDPDAEEDGSACTGGCADAWPPLTVEDEPTAGDDVTASLGTITREDGSTQVTAGEWPLYYFAQDESPGDVNGQGANDVWYVLGPDSEPIREAPSDDDGSGDDGPGY
jgi:predicted lipoprotein with Yx(FWY)xxD motif